MSDLPGQPSTRQHLHRACGLQDTKNQHRTCGLPPDGTHPGVYRTGSHLNPTQTAKQAPAGHLGLVFRFPDLQNSRVNTIFCLPPTMGVAPCTAQAVCRHAGTHTGVYRTCRHLSQATAATQGKQPAPQMRSADMQAPRPPPTNQEPQKQNPIYPKARTRLNSCMKLNDYPWKQQRKTCTAQGGLPGTTPTTKTKHTAPHMQSAGIPTRTLLSTVQAAIKHSGSILRRRILSQFLVSGTPSRVLGSKRETRVHKQAFQKQPFLPHRLCGYCGKLSSHLGRLGIMQPHARCCLELPRRCNFLVRTLNTKAMLSAAHK